METVRKRFGRRFGRSKGETIMITLPSSVEGRTEFWSKHIFVRLHAKLNKKGYNVPLPQHYKNTDMDIRLIMGNSQSYIKLTFRPARKKYHYFFNVSGSSYELSKLSRRFRWMNPDLTTLFDVFEFLYKKFVDELEIERLDKVKKEELQKKRTEEAKEIAKAIHCAVEVSYSTFRFNFTTRDGREIKMNFRLTDEDVLGFEIEGKIKRHHFYSIIDSLRKSVPDNPDNNGLVSHYAKKRRIDLTSDIVTRIAKNESIKNLQFSKIRSWKRNFNLEGN